MSRVHPQRFPPDEFVHLRILTERCPFSHPHCVWLVFLGPEKKASLQMQISGCDASEPAHGSHVPATPSASSRKKMHFTGISPFCREHCSLPMALLSSSLINFPLHLKPVVRRICRVVLSPTGCFIPREFLSQQKTQH